MNTPAPFHAVTAAEYTLREQFALDMIVVLLNCAVIAGAVAAACWAANYPLRVLYHVLMQRHYSYHAQRVADTAPSLSELPRFAVQYWCTLSHKAHRHGTLAVLLYPGAQRWLRPRCPRTNASKTSTLNRPYL